MNTLPILRAGKSVPAITCSVQRAKCKSLAYLLTPFCPFVGLPLKGTQLPLKGTQFPLKGERPPQARGQNLFIRAREDRRTGPGAANKKNIAIASPPLFGRLYHVK